MTINVNKRPRGRPRAFALEDAIRTGQHLFHEHGYENVSVAALTDAMGITAPSFYTAFSSKAAFFKNALQLYSATVVPLDRFLVTEKPPQSALGDMLVAAARAYVAHPRRRGCLVLEHAKALTTEWGIAAAQTAADNRARVQAFLDASAVAEPVRVADFVAMTMLGLSAAAREGWEEDRLIAVAETAGAALNQMILREQI